MTILQYCVYCTGNAHGSSFLPLPYATQFLYRSSVPSSAFSFSSAQLRKKFVPTATGSGEGKSSGVSRLTADVEYSDCTNDELLLFLYEFDLATRLQRALNQNQYEAAQVFRASIAEVQEEVSKLRVKKTGAASSKDDAQNTELALLRLRTKLAEAIEKEDYSGAAKLRDEVSKLEAEELAATAKALAFQNVKFGFRLGQKVKHKVFGYRGVICGMDPICYESAEWIKNARIDDLPRGRNQPFYQVLVDRVPSEFRQRNKPRLLVTCVAEDNLEAPTVPDAEKLDHPYTYLLFYGMDGGGDYIPTKELRLKYNASRYERSED